jgi:hypothetical protein
LSQELFSEPLPLGIISMASVSAASLKSILITGIDRPVEVCWLTRVTGCTTEERSGCSFVARSQPVTIACLRRYPSTSTPAPISTL